jgi:predicted RNA-binding Zn ribbon-like protein
VSVQPIPKLPLIGGHVALDFVNTAEDREGAAGDEALRDPADLRAWGVRYDLIGRSATSPDAEAELQRARAARELVYRMFRARALGETPRTADLERLGELAAAGYAAGRLRVGEDGATHWQWNRSELASIRHVVVTRAAELLQADPPPRLKQCPGHHCGWLFLDTTKRGNRRWCQMRECGQEAKDERRRERRRGRDDV